MSSLALIQESAQTATPNASRVYSYSREAIMAAQPQQLHPFAAPHGAHWPHCSRRAPRRMYDRLQDGSMSYLSLCFCGPP